MYADYTVSRYLNGTTLTDYDDVHWFYGESDLHSLYYDVFWAGDYGGNALHYDDFWVVAELRIVIDSAEYYWSGGFDGDHPGGNGYYPIQSSGVNVRPGVPSVPLDTMDCPFDITLTALPWHLFDKTTSVVMDNNSGPMSGWLGWYSDNSYPEVARIHYHYAVEAEVLWFDGAGWGTFDFEDDGADSYTYDI
jgi:hypothetical protein